MPSISGIVGLRDSLDGGCTPLFHPPLAESALISTGTSATGIRDASALTQTGTMPSSRQRKRHSVAQCLIIQATVMSSKMTSNRAFQKKQRLMVPPRLGCTIVGIFQVIFVKKYIINRDLILVKETYKRLPRKWWGLIISLLGRETGRGRKKTDGDRYPRMRIICFFKLLLPALAEPQCMRA